MKKTDLKKLIGEDIENWEITNAEYNKENKTITLHLKNFEWQGIPFGRDYKEYTGKTKEITIFDKYAFCYFDKDRKIKSIQEYIKTHNGFCAQHLPSIFNSPQIIPTTSFQIFWNNLLNQIGAFDKDEYKKLFLEEFKTLFIDYCTEHPEQTELLELVTFFEEVANTLQFDQA